MTSARHATPRRTRAWLAAGLASVALLLGGCVYLRLLELKRQLADFDRYFTLRTDVGATMTFLDPVLLTDDLRWIGVTPESTKKIGTAERWAVRWVKQLPAGMAEETPYDIEVEMFFTRGKLSRVVIPERYFAFVPKPLFFGVLRSLGGAKIDQAKRSLEANLSDEASRKLGNEVLASRPKLAKFGEMLGAPTSRRSEGDETVIQYRYTPSQAGTKNGVFDMSFRFDSASGEMNRLQGRTPVGRINIDFVARPKLSSAETK
jgi:hypothetical protein